MEQLSIVLKEVPNGGVFEAFIYEAKAGEVTFAIVPEGYILIDHTEVMDAYKGKGIGKTLIDSAVAWAIEREMKVKPVCPYAVKVFDQMSEWQNIRV